MLGLDALGWPLAAAIAAAACAALVWIHRRAAREAALDWAPAFLVRDGEGAGDRGERLRSPWLLLTRVAAVGALVALAWPAEREAGGTLVLASGPVEPDLGWASPVHVVRAGARPSLHSLDEARNLMPVEASPDWATALALGRTHAPQARVVVAEQAARERASLVGAAASLTEDGRIQVIADLSAGAGGVDVWLEDPAGGRTSLVPLNQDALTRAASARPKAGGAVVRTSNGDLWPLCVPDARPTTVSMQGFTDAWLRAFEAVGRLERAPGDAADLRSRRVDMWTSARSRWAPFVPPVTWFEVPAMAGPGVLAPLRDARSGESVAAVVTGFHVLPDGGEAAWLAGGARVGDVVEGPEGRVVRLGFEPEGQGLVQTSAWPVWVAGQVEASAFARSRCRRLEVSETLEVTTSEDIILSGPGMDRVVVTAREGVAVLGPFDHRGLLTLRPRKGSPDAVAWLAVEPPRGGVVTENSPPPALGYRRPAAEPRSVALYCALALSAIVVATSGRRRVLWAWLPTAVIAAVTLNLHGPAIGRGQVIVAVDTSRSVPEETRSIAVERVEASLGERASARVEGDDRARRTLAVGAAPPASDDAARTRLQPLVQSAAELAGPAGVVVLLSDGRAPDVVFDPGCPVVAVPVPAAAPDAVVVAARARRLGDRVYVEARLRSSAPTRATWEIARESGEVSLSPREDVDITATVRSGSSESLVVRVASPGDSNASNDVLRVPIEDYEEGVALRVGSGDLGVAALTAAGFKIQNAAPSVLSTLAGARLVWLQDVAAPQLPNAAIEGLERAVRAGTTLVVSGRSQAFGPGGWGTSPLNALSPLGPPTRPPGAARLGVMLLVDRSGSMAIDAGGVGPYGLARVVDAVAGQLAPGNDELGVIAFGGASEVLRPLAAVRVGEVAPVPRASSGGTRLAPALVDAVTALGARDVDTRAVVVVSDGVFADSEAELQAASALAARDEVRVYAIAVGRDRDLSVLETLTGRLGGVAVEATSESAVQVALSVASEAASPGQVEMAAGPVMPGPAWANRVGGRPGAGRGGVVTEAKTAARVLATLGGRPLVAEWALGAGRVIAIATDAWDAPEAVWARLLESARSQTERAVRVESADLERRRLRLEVGALGPLPEGVVTLPSGDQMPVAVRRTGALTFDADVRSDVVASGGPAMLEVRVADGSSQARFALSPSPEATAVGVDITALEALAFSSGGEVLLDPALAGETVDRLLGREAGPPLFDLLALVALALLLADAVAWGRASR